MNPFCQIEYISSDSDVACCDKPDVGSGSVSISTVSL
jgi:hypothetical protein